jgi:hypothetical protein
VAYRATSIGLWRCDDRDMLVVIQPLLELPTLAILFFVQTAKSLWSIFRGSGSSRNCCAPVGISRPSQCSMPMVYRLSCSKIRWIWRTSFYIDGCSTVRTVALRLAIFKRKKGLGTIRLGLIYNSMVLPQLPSCDTVLLRFCSIHR